MNVGDLKAILADLSEDRKVYILVPAGLEQRTIARAIYFQESDGSDEGKDDAVRIVATYDTGPLDMTIEDGWTFRTG